jgi:hypothetical protein
MIEQIGIGLTGVVAIFLTQDKREQWRRWACIFGMVGQPFWFYATYKAGQWGIFALCVLYALSWARGINNHWVPVWRAWRKTAKTGREIRSTK